MKMSLRCECGTVLGQRCKKLILGGSKYKLYRGICVILLGLGGSVEPPHYCVAPPLTKIELK